MINFKAKDYFSEIKLPTEWRSFSAFGYDILAAIFAWIVAYSLRFNFNIPPEFISSLQQTIYWAVALQGFVFVAYGLYKGVWRFASLPDLKRIIIAVGLSSVC